MFCGVVCKLVIDSADKNKHKNRQLLVNINKLISSIENLCTKLNIFSFAPP
jgi:hypothetical protein